MSTRRTTRASSRGTSPAVSEMDIPTTTRRTSRRTNTPLPVVANRPSTAYGTNATAKPTTLKPTMGAVTEEMLDAMINPITSSSPLVDPSHSIEQAFYENADIESSVVSEMKVTPKAPPPRKAMPTQYIPQQQPILEDIIRINRVPRVQPREVDTYGEWSRAVLGCLRDFVNYTVPGLQNSLKKFGATKWNVLFGCLFMFTAYLMMCSIQPADEGAASPSTGSILSRWMPNWSNPKELFTPDEYTSLDRRLRRAERDISTIKEKLNMDSASISKLQDIVPHVVMLKRGRDGKAIIPDDFWHGLRDKIRNDNTIFQQKLDSASGGLSESATKAIAASEARAVLQGPDARKAWDQFLENNRRRVTDWMSNSNNATPSPGSDDNVGVSRDDLIKLVEEKWEEARESLRNSEAKYERKITDLTKQFEHSLKDAARQEGKHQIPRDQLKSLVSHYVKQMTAGIQLDGLSNVQIKHNGLQARQLVNYLSQGTGARINPILTSPNYVFPHQDFWQMKKWALGLTGYDVPIPNPPVAALTPWDEHGDCWCTPHDGSDEFGPSLAVMMGAIIYPSQVIVEHISSKGSLDPGAAPKDMELLVLVDEESFERTQKASELVFPREESENRGLPKGWVRAGEWRYEAEAEEVQAFPLALDLKRLNAPVSDVMVRVKSTWGVTGYVCLYRVRLNGDPV